MLSDEEIELHPVARIYYTRYQTRTYKRASVTDGPGEPLCFLSLAKEVVRRKVAAACAERDARIAELERRLEEARKDAMHEAALICDHLDAEVDKYPAACADAIRAAIKEQT